MKLSETTFSQFINWCEENKEYWHPERQYITIPKLRIIYDYCVDHNLKCEGNSCIVTWKNNEWISNWTIPEPKVTKEDLIWNLFHEVWCKAEYAIRCSRTDNELGYETVKADFGLRVIKELRRAA